MTEQRIQRAATRAPINRPIELQVGEQDDPQPGICVDISIGGLFVNTEPPLARGTIVRFALLLPEATIVRGLAEVVWARAKSNTAKAGVGMKFRALEQVDRQMVFKLVSRHIKERLARKSATDFQSEPESEATVSREPELTASEDAAAVGTADQTEVIPTPATERPAELPLVEVATSEGASHAEEPGPSVDLSHEPRSQEQSDDEPTEPEEQPQHQGWFDRPSEQQAESIADVADASESPWSTTEPSETVTPASASRAPSKRKLPSAWSLIALLVVTLSLVAYFTIGQGSKDRELARPQIEPSPATREPIEPPATVTQSAPAPEVNDSDLAEEPVDPGASSSAGESSQEPTSVPVVPPVSPEPVAPAESQPFTLVEEIDWRMEGDAIIVTISVNGSTSDSRYTTFRLQEGGHREVIRLKGIDVEFARREIPIGGPVIERVRTGYHSRGSSGDLQVVFDLSAPQFRITSILPLEERIEIHIAQ